MTARLALRSLARQGHLVGTVTGLLPAGVRHPNRSATGAAVIFENDLAAGGSTAIGRAARAAPDGYTLSFGTLVTHVFNAAQPLPYDVVNDFAPISLLPFEPFLIVGRRDMPADDLKGLIALLKRNPDKLSAGTSAVGSLSHAASLHFQRATGTRVDLKSYRGVGPALQAFLTGETDILIESAVTLRPHLQRLKPFAVMAKNRYTGAPELPTVDEAGSIGLYASLWRALWAPKIADGFAGSNPDMPSHAVRSQPIHEFRSKRRRAAAFRR